MPFNKNLIFIFCISAALTSQAAEENTLPERGSFGLGWLDQSQAAASNYVNSFAKTVDRFFGEPRSDLEAAYSTLRISTEYFWHQTNHSDTKLRIRGKIHLPIANERISLLFTEDEGEGKDFYDQTNVESLSQESTNANLQFNLFDSLKNRLDIRFGLRSSLQGKASIRYRHELPSGETIQHRFINTFYFVDGDGFGSLSRYELDQALTSKSLLRWSNDFRMEENFSGAQWGSRISYSRQVSDQTALSYYFNLNGLTAPKYISAYGVGFRVRKSIGRPWLFAEIEPGHAWSKFSVHTERQPDFYIFFRLEAAIGRI